MGISTPNFQLRYRGLGQGGEVGFPSRACWRPTGDAMLSSYMGGEEPRKCRKCSSVERIEEVVTSAICAETEDFRSGAIEFAERRHTWWPC